VGSEAEYLEIALRDEVDPEMLRVALDAALSPGLDVIEAVVAHEGSLADRIDASRWRLELPEIDPAVAAAAVASFLDTPEVLVERMTKQGRRSFDSRAAVTHIAVTEQSDLPSGADGAPCAIIDLVVRQVTPAVRPDDVLSGLHVVAGLEPPVPPRVTRLAQGRLTEQGEIVDPLDADRETSRMETGVIGGR
jgi:radical SAM-linked protein